MGKNFARKIATMLLSIAMVFSCLFVFSACKDKEDPAVEVKVTSISVALVENSPYTLSENVLDAFYNSEKIEFTASDFVVTANKSDNTSTVLSQKSETVDGYTLTSTVPADDVTPLGEYKLTFAYAGVSDVELQVKVNKGNIDVSGVTLKSLTYNGAEQTLQIADILNLPANVTAEFVSGNTGTDAHGYDAVVRFTYTGADAESYNAIPDTTITWTMEKATYNVSNISWVRGTNTVYTGLPQTVEISVDGELPDGVTIKGYLNNEFTNAGHYTAKVQFNYDSLNYNKPAVADFEWDIEKAPLTVKANNATIIFGENATNTGVAYTGFVNGETKDVLGGALSYEYGGYYVGADVDTYKILPSGLSSNNYNIEYKTGDLVVNKATYSYADIAWVYDGPYTFTNNAQKPTVTGSPALVGYNIVATKSSVEDESINAGTYLATYTVTSFKNYDFTGTVPTKEYVINKAALSISANDKTITFGDEPSHAGAHFVGFKGHDNSDIFAGQEFVYEYNYKKGDDAGPYTITISGVTADNYDITFHTGTLNVQAITLQYTDVEFEYSEPFNYDGTEKALTVTGVPDYVTYNVTYTKAGATAVPKNAGTYVAKFTITPHKNYVYMGQPTTQEFVINKVALTITANNKTITFGDEPSHAGVSYNGFVAGEHDVVLGGSFNYTYGGYKAGSDIGEYDIEISGRTSENYEISYVSGTLTVNPLQVNVSSYTWNYTTLTYTGVKQEPKLNEISPYISANYVYTQNGDLAFPINVGSYKASVTFNTSKNYEVVGTVADLTFEIGKAPLVITAKNHTIYYQDAAANDGVTYDSFVGGETQAVLVGELVFDYDYEQGDDVGVYTITPSGLTSSNYDIEFEQGTLTVQILTVSISNFVWNYTNAYTYSGVAQKPTLSSYPNYLVFEEYTYIQDLFDAESIDVGEYVAIATFADTGNYEIEEEVSIDYIINKASLTITAKDHTITYLDAAANNGVAYSGFVNNETSAVLQGTLAFDYDGYASGSNVGTYRITPSDLSSNNYEISYVAGILTVEAITLQYSDYSFNYTGAENFVYNGTAVEFVALSVPAYVQYSIVYKLNDTTVVDEAVDAGTYSATFVPQTSVNYIFEGEALKVTFTIDKATIDPDELYFTIDSEKVTTVESVGDGENSPSYSITYKETMYYDGAEHYVNFVNNTGIEGVTVSLTHSDEQRFVKNISTHHFSAYVSVSESVLKNYEEIEHTSYMLIFVIEDYFKAVKVTYVDRIDTEVEHVQPGEIELSRDALTTQSFDGVIIDIEFVLAEEGLEEVYFVNLYTDRSYTTSVLSDLSNLNNYDNVLYVGANFAGGSVFDDMAVKFVMEFKADTNEYSYIFENEINYSTNESTTKSINIETESVLFYVDYTSSLFTTSCELGDVQVTEQPDSNGDGQPEYVETITFTSEAYTLQAGVNNLLIRYNYTYNEVTYSYTRSVNIVYSVSSAGNFTITYKGESGNVTGADNAVEISNVTIQDIVGDDMMTADPKTAIADICDNIEVNALGSGNYKEEVGANGESLREVKIEGGNAYLCVPVKEKPDDGTVVFPGLTNYSYTADGDEPVDGDTEGGEDLTTPTTSLFMYILLNFGFDIDYNTNAMITADGGTIHNSGEFAEHGYIEMKTGQFLTVTADNSSAMLMIMRVADSMEDIENSDMNDWAPTEYQMFYGSITRYSFDKTGVYSLAIMPTAFFFEVDCEPKAYIIDVTSSSGESGQTPVNPEIEYTVQAEDYLGHGVNNEGVMTNESQMCDIVVEDGVITLNNWDNTKYLEIATNSNGNDDYFVVGFGEDIIIEKWASNFVMNFEEAGTYYIAIGRSVQDEPVTKTIIINVYGFENNFLNITANGSNISVDLTQTYDLVSEDAVIYNNMLPDNQGNIDENEYVEAYIGEVAGLGSTYELAFTSIYSNLIYEVDTDTTIAYENGKATLNVKNDGTFNYVEFEIKNLDANGVDAPEIVVRAYFCNKTERLKYHTLTIGDKTFDIKANSSRYGDFGDVILNDGVGHVIIEEDDFNFGTTTNITFKAYSGYTLPANSLDYLILTEEGYESLERRFISFKTYADLTSYIETLKTNEMAYQATNETTLTMPVLFGRTGVVRLYIIAEGANEQAFTYGYISELFVPFDIKAEEVEQYSYDNVEYVSGLEMSVEVGGKTYSIANGDIEFESEIPEYYIRLDHKKDELVDAQTGKVKITSVVATGVDFELSDMDGNPLSSTNFELAVTRHPIFGDSVMFVGSAAGMGSAQFVLAFNDSMPRWAGQTFNDTVPEGVEISFSLTDSNNVSKTYSTKTNNFYFDNSRADYGGYYYAYTRIDFRRLDFETYDTNPNDGLITSWIDFDTFNFVFTGDFEGITFTNFVDGWDRSNYVELRGGIVHHNDFGYVVSIEAICTYYRFNIYLVFSDSIPMPYEGEYDEMQEASIFELMFGENENCDYFESTIKPGLTITDLVFGGDFENTLYDIDDQSQTLIVESIGWSDIELADEQTTVDVMFMLSNNFLDHDGEENIVIIEDLNKAEDNIIEHENMIGSGSLVINTETNSVTFKISQCGVMQGESGVEVIPFMTLTYTIYLV